MRALQQAARQRKKNPPRGTSGTAAFQASDVEGVGMILRRHEPPFPANTRKKRKAPVADDEDSEVTSDPLDLGLSKNVTVCRSIRKKPKVHHSSIEPRLRLDRLATIGEQLEDSATGEGLQTASESERPGASYQRSRTPDSQTEQPANPSPTDAEEIAIEQGRRCLADLKATPDEGEFSLSDFSGFHDKSSYLRHEDTPTPSRQPSPALVVLSSPSSPAADFGHNAAYTQYTTPMSLIEPCNSIPTPSFLDTGAALASTHPASHDHSRPEHINQPREAGGIQEIEDMKPPGNTQRHAETEQSEDTQLVQVMERDKDNQTQETRRRTKRTGAAGPSGKFWLIFYGLLCDRLAEVAHLLHNCPAHTTYPT